MKLYGEKIHFVFIVALMLCFAWYSPVSAKQNNPLETIVAEDGSIWERDMEPGFGNKNNVCIVSLCQYRDSLYAITRNDVSGCEIWRTNGKSWEQVHVPGFTDSMLHKNVNGAYGKLIKFKNYLYAAVSSGGEGAFLYGSIGCELWRFDGKQWEPIISNSKDEDEPGAITAISGCSDNDGNTIAEITDSGKNWAIDQWVGGVLRITSGNGKGRVFNILGNTSDTLVVQQNEIANKPEYTNCAAFIPDPTAPQYAVGAVSVNDSYEIGIGEDENGFGEVWNKTIIDMAVLNGELYIPIGHNYEDGTRIWKTSDGISWTPTSDYSFGQFHGYDLDGNPIGCLPGYNPSTIGMPVSSSATHFGKSDVSGIETLYIGATGTTGCNGRGARALRIENDTWNYIVDNFVDENNTGTNENGLGDSASFLTGNFQVWSWANYDGRLFASIARQSGGGRLIYSETGGPEDGAWQLVVGKGSSSMGDAPLMPNGFDGVSGPSGFGSNIASNLFTHDDALYAGTLMVINSLAPPSPSDPVFDGADIWRATGPAEALVWARVTGDGFGDANIHHFDSFCPFKGSMYVAASNLFSGTPQQKFTTPDPLGGKIYRLKKVPQFVSVSSVAISLDTIGNPGISWTTDSEDKLLTFNVYRSDSEALNHPYMLINSIPIQATGAGSTYLYTDSSATPGKYYYKIEGVNKKGDSKFYGPYGPITRP
jgi:hypothetical protein